MKTDSLAAMVLALAVAVPSWAGVEAGPAPIGAPAMTGAPAMNEGGLVMLALALVGTGLTILGGGRR